MFDTSVEGRFALLISLVASPSDQIYLRSDKAKVPFQLLDNCFQCHVFGHVPLPEDWFDSFPILCCW